MQPAIAEARYGIGQNASIPGRYSNQIASEFSARIVLCHGCFDLLHPGHVAHLEAARAMGDSLVVSVTSDRYARKGPGRPAFDQTHRARMLQALACVDRVVITDHPTAAEALRDIRPAVYAKGADYTRDTLAEIEVQAAEAVGARIVFTDTPKMSSSALINRHVETPEIAEYLEHCRAHRYAERIPELLARISDKRVLFVGETIIDEYVYVTPLGKPSKEFIVCGQEVERERFMGGVFAAMQHARSFCGYVDYTSGVELQKTRYVDRDSTRKLFEIYGQRRDIAEGPMLDQIGGYEAVVVTDFGHGMLGKLQRELLMTGVGSDPARFLAVNTQTNAGNHGFNLITKYKRADYVCLDLPEARLAVGDPAMSPEDCCRVLTNRMPIGRIAITNGRHGCTMLDKRGHDKPNPFTVPAFTTKAVDTMGAGDAFLAVTAPLAAVATADEFPMLAFIGNVVGAIKVGIVGHRQPVDKATVLRYCETLLK